MESEGRRQRERWEPAAQQHSQSWEAEGGSSVEPRERVLRLFSALFITISLVN